MLMNSRSDLAEARRCALKFTKVISSRDHFF